MADTARWHNLNGLSIYRNKNSKPRLVHLSLTIYDPKFPLNDNNGLIAVAISL